jgi:hypothetical protein
MKRFKTNANGEIPAGCKLDANAVYALVRDMPPAASTFSDKQQLIDWINNCILGDLRTLRFGIQTYLADSNRDVKNGLGGGNFLLASGCCLALEYVARIFNGGNNAEVNVKRYTEKFLKPINNKYADVSGLMWKVFRNGLVHGSWPQSIEIEAENGQKIRVGVGVEPSDPHLAPERKWSGPSLALNAITFMEDLEASVERGFAQWILDTTDPVLERGAPRLLILHKDDQVQLEVQRVLEWNSSSADPSGGKSDVASAR